MRICLVIHGAFDLLADLEAVQQEKDRDGDDRIHNGADKLMDRL